MPSSLLDEWLDNVRYAMRRSRNDHRLHGQLSAAERSLRAAARYAKPESEDDGRRYARFMRNAVGTLRQVARETTRPDVAAVASETEREITRIERDLE